mmetsp:Transcript_71115/g.140995  ORF Transcript_71115/g.140995 Transcript_71115/m.140995 type:complete len:161 (-) Transcript_71115:550-1032(-)
MSMDGNEAAAARVPDGVTPLAFSKNEEEEPAEPPRLSLAERGAAAEREFAALERARKRAQSPTKASAAVARPIAPAPAALRVQNRAASPSHRTPRSAFDSRLADLPVAQRSHRTPREGRMPSEGATDKLDPHLFRVLQYGGQRQTGVLLPRHIGQPLKPF